MVLLAKQPVSQLDADNTLRIAFGVPIPPDLHEPLEQRFGLELVHVYGLTEATIVAWNRRPDRTIGAAGPVSPDYDVRILDDQDVPVEVGEIGQICVRPREPNSTFTEYWGDADRTVRAWRNLWFHTGDRGHYDGAGNLWFSDRMDDVIRRMGEFISSSEVEQAALAHPDVQLAAAYGVPSELLEEEVMLAVVPRLGADLSPAELRAWCAERLIRFAVPRYVDVRVDLPMTPTGKVEKYKLKQRGVTATAYDARASNGAGPDRPGPVRA
jgi:carnitine-CoA ligase